MFSFFYFLDANGGKIDNKPEEEYLHIQNIYLRILRNIVPTLYLIFVFVRVVFCVHYSIILLLVHSYIDEWVASQKLLAFLNMVLLECLVDLTTVNTIKEALHKEKEALKNTF